MDDIYERIAKLPPEKRHLLEEKLKQEGIGTDVLTAGETGYPVRTINKAEKKEYYRTTAAQKRMYMVEQSTDCGTSYNIPVAIHIHGRPDIKQVERALDLLVQRHETLRTRFDVMGGEIVQNIEKEPGFTLSYEDRLGKQDENKVDYQQLISNFVRKFDLHKAPLFRAKLVKIEEDAYVFLLDMHHIISDGLSMVNLMKDFSTLYTGKPLLPLNVQYKDYAEMQHTSEESGQFASMDKYWTDMFEEEAPVLNLPEDFPRPAYVDYMGDTCEIVLPLDLSLRVHSLLSEKSTTLFVFFLAAYSVLLSGLSGQEDMVIGIPVTNRDYEQTSPLIGMFVNTMAIRSRPEGKKTFSGFLEEIRIKWLDSYRYQEYPFERLIEKAGIKRRPGRNLLFDTVLNVHSMETMDDLENMKLGNISMHPVHLPEASAKYDLTIYISHTGERIKIKGNYRTSIFKKDTIRYILNEFSKLLEQILENPDQEIGRFNLFSIRECIQTNANKWGIQPDLAEDLEWNQPITKRFEKQVEKYPDKMAVLSPQGFLTYGQLNSQSNQLADAIVKRSGRFKKQGTKGVNGEKIALLFGHDIPMIVGILGVLKAGGAYVPLDTGYPEKRLVDIFIDSGADILVTDTGNLSRAEAIWGEKDKYGLINVDLPEGSNENPVWAFDMDAHAYIMYTSGSTGVPKGVIQNHRNIMHFIKEYSRILHIRDADNTALFTSYSHTVSVIDIFSALLNGGTLSVFSFRDEGSMIRSLQWIGKEKVTIVHTVPTLFRKLVKTNVDTDLLRSIRCLVLGGEAVYRKDVAIYQRLFSDTCQFVNLFGASEIIIASAYILNKDTQPVGLCVPVGYPLEGVEMFFKSTQGRPARVFEVAEMVTRSKYLSPGYHDLKEENGVRPLQGSKAGSNVYASGDFGMVMADSSIVYFGRKDSQIKIRGFRVELSEIEYAMAEIQGIDRVVLKVFGEEAGQYLVAFYETTNQQPVSGNTIRRYLRSRLPEYMIPTSYCHRKAFPLLQNGKVDVLSLKESDSMEDGQEIKEPVNETEERLWKLWKELLDRRVISTDTGFFDAGGNSILVMSLYDRIKNTLFPELKVQDIFQYPTISKLAGYILKKKKEQHAPAYEETLHHLFDSLEQGAVSISEAIDAIMEREDG